MTETETETATDGDAHALARPSDTDAETKGRLAHVQGTTVGRYILLEPLGAGGMGEVYAAFDPELDRRIALKLLSPTRAAEGGRAAARMVREAQAMARLSHPNVVAVHDAGTVGDQVFIAMDLVDGQTLRQWLTAEPRHWRPVLDVFVAAGRGLAAAHAAGLVHRDFKPANVLVSHDQRVLVTDFGLVRQRDDLDEPSTEDGALADGRSPLSAELTRAGAVMGTPAYMSPEQHQGLPTDARSDQFSFCVALYEGLYGARPFTSATRIGLVEAVLEGSIDPVPEGASVPGWVRKIVLRGLHIAPDERFADMPALLDALRRDPAIPRRRALFGLGIAGLVAATAWVARESSPTTVEPCADAGQTLETIWDPTVREQVEAGFSASDARFAPAAFERTARTIDRYADRWVEAHTQACRATRVHGEVSEDLLDRRMVCLDGGRRQLRVLVSVLQKPEPITVARAVDAARALPDPGNCADLETLTRTDPRPPADADPAKIEQIRAGLDEVRVLRDLGDYARALDVAAPTVDQARAIGWELGLVQALVLLGEVQYRGTQAAQAEATLLEAAFAAEGIGADMAFVTAARRLVFVLAEHAHRPDDAQIWGRHAQAVLRRMHGHEQLQAELDSDLGILARIQGEFSESERLHRRALSTFERILEPDDPDLAAARADLANVLAIQERYDEATTLVQQALASQLRTLGSDHPAVANSRMTLSTLHGRQGRHQPAIEMLQAALSTYEVVFGPEHRTVGLALFNLGVEAKQLGRYEEAIDGYERALGILTAGNIDPLTEGSIRNNIGSAWLAAGQPQRSLPWLTEALALKTEGGGPEHPSLIGTLLLLGEVQLAVDDPTAAMQSMTRAQAIAEAKLDPQHSGRIEALLGIGEVHLHQGRAQLAIAPLSEAHTLASAKPRDQLTADVAFALARALGDSGGSMDRARTLAQEALDGVARADPPRADTQRAIEAWVAEHPAP